MGCFRTILPLLTWRLCSSVTTTEDDVGHAKQPINSERYYDKPFGLGLHKITIISIWVSWVPPTFAASFHPPSLAGDLGISNSNSFHSFWGS